MSAVQKSKPKSATNLRLVPHQLSPDDRLDVALSQARGMAFVINQARHGQIQSEELTGYALWALEDLLAQAAQAFEEIRLQSENPISSTKEASQ